jgi:hypothetical protein
MKHNSGEIATFLTFTALIVIGVTTFVSSVFLKNPKNKIVTNPRAQAVCCDWDDAGQCRYYCPPVAPEPPSPEPSPPVDNQLPVPTSSTGLPVCGVCEGLRCNATGKSPCQGGCNFDDECGGSNSTVPLCGTCNGNRCQYTGAETCKGGCNNDEDCAAQNSQRPCFKCNGQNCESTNITGCSMSAPGSCQLNSDCGLQSNIKPCFKCNGQNCESTNITGCSMSAPGSCQLNSDCAVIPIVTKVPSSLNQIYIPQDNSTTGCTCDTNSKRWTGTNCKLTEVIGDCSLPDWNTDFYQCFCLPNGQLTGKCDNEQVKIANQYGNCNLHFLIDLNLPIPNNQQLILKINKIKISTDIKDSKNWTNGNACNVVNGELKCKQILNADDDINGYSYVCKFNEKNDPDICIPLPKKSGNNDTKYIDGNQVVIDKNIVSLRNSAQYNRQVAVQCMQQTKCDFQLNLLDQIGLDPNGEMYACEKYHKVDNGIDKCTKVTVNGKPWGDGNNSYISLSYPLPIKCFKGPNIHVQGHSEGCYRFDGEPIQ